MNLAVVLVLTTAASAVAAQCLTYSGEVELEGILSSHAFPEQPNYGSIAKGDAKATYFFVSPREPFCVAQGDNSEGLEPSEPKVERVQLVFDHTPEKSYASLRRFLGMTVVCRGSLYHSISGHHHSPVLLWDAKCEKAQQTAPRDAPKRRARER